jgi:hypothetical protein
VAARKSKLSSSERLELNSPIPILNSLLTVLPEQRDELVKSIQLRKLFDLLADEGINPDDKDAWFVLSLRLAARYHPGFQVANPPARRGRPEKWGIAQQELLIDRLESLISKSGKSCAWACGELLKKFPKEYAAIEKSASLAARYREAIRSRRAFHEAWPDPIERDRIYERIFSRIISGAEADEN